jgi:hypothetical protein
MPIMPIGRTDAARKEDVVASTIYAAGQVRATYTIGASRIRRALTALGLAERAGDIARHPQGRRASRQG